jgi:hypothetical protein
LTGCDFGGVGVDGHVGGTGRGSDVEEDDEDNDEDDGVGRDETEDVTVAVNEAAGRGG